MKHVTRSIRFPEDLFEQLEQVAEREDRTVNSLVVHLVRRGMGLYRGPQQTLPIDPSSPIAQREPGGGTPSSVSEGWGEPNPSGPIDQ